MGVPWFKLYSTDYLADSKVRMLNRAQRSMLLDLWCYCSIDGSVSSDPEDLRLLLGEDFETVDESLPRLRAFFKEENGRFYSPRLQIEAIAYDEKCQKLKRNASKGGAIAQAKAKAIAQAKSTELEPELELEKEEVLQKASSPSAPEVLPLKVAKEKKPRKVKTTGLKGDDSLEAFNAIWEAFPRTKREWSQVTREWADVPVAPGSRLEGENNFQAIVDSGVCKPHMLYYAFWAYLQESPKVKDGFIQQVSTFFGPKKATYLEWLERAEFYKSQALGVAQ